MMNIIFSYISLAVAKIIDNALSTCKTIFIQKNKALIASLFLSLSCMISYEVTKGVIQDDSIWATVIASIGAGIGCFIAIKISDVKSKERIYVNVIMSKDKEEMKRLRDFLAANHITSVATDSYNKDWSEKDLTITAYAETKAQSRLIDGYFETSPAKFKRIINGDEILRGI